MLFSLAVDPSMLCVGISLTLNCSMKIKRSGFFHRTTMNLHSTTRAVENPHTQHRVICWPSSMCVMLVLNVEEEKKKICENFPSLALHCSCVGNGHADTRKQHNINFLWEFSIKLIVFLNIIFVSMPRGETYPSYTRALSALCYRKKRAMQSIYRMREVRVEIELD